MDSQQQTIVTAALTGAGSTIGAVVGWWGHRRRERRIERGDARAILVAERQADQNAQVAAIAERDALIRTITETLIDPLRQEVVELREWKVKAERRIDESEERNDKLVAFIYKLVGIIHRAGFDHEILPSDVPPGIHL